MFAAFLGFFFISILFVLLLFVFAKAALREFCSSSRLKGVWFPDNFFVTFYQLSLWRYHQTRKHSSGMRTARFPSSGGGRGRRGLGTPPTPWMQTPPPKCRSPSPCMQMPSPPGCRPLPWSCDLWCTLGSQPPMLVMWPVMHAFWNRMTAMCKYITLPQTSSAGGKKLNDIHQDQNK